MVLATLDVRFFPAFFSLTVQIDWDLILYKASEQSITASKSDGLHLSHDQLVHLNQAKMNDIDKERVYDNPLC